MIVLALQCGTGWLGERAAISFHMPTTSMKETNYYRETNVNEALDIYLHNTITLHPAAVWNNCQLYRKDCSLVERITTALDTVLLSEKTHTWKKLIYPSRAPIFLLKLHVFLCSCIWCWKEVGSYFTSSWNYTHWNYMTVKLPKITIFWMYYN